MPLYEFQCPECRGISTAFRRIAQRNSPLSCGCGTQMCRVILTPPYGQVQPEAHYLCPVTGKQITSWRQRKNVFAEHNLMDANEIPLEETKRTVMKKKADRDELAKDYLPPDLQDKLSVMGKGNKDRKNDFTM